MPAQTVILTTDQGRFVDDCVRRLGYLNTSAVVRAGLELLQRQITVAANAAPMKGKSSRSEPPYWVAKADDPVLAMNRHFEDRSAFEDRINALVDEFVRSGAYPSMTEAMVDLVRYVELRFHFDTSAAGEHRLRLVPPPAE